MIAKVIKGTDLKATIRYNTHKVEGGEAYVLSANNLPIADISNTRMLECALRNAAAPVKRFQSNIKQYVFHGVISPEEQDLSDETLTNIANDYMQEMGYGEQPYFIVKHRDTEHTHVHIVSIDTDRRGKRCVNDSNLYFRSNDVRGALEKKYSLSSPQMSAKEKEEARINNAVNFLNDTSFLENEVPSKDYRNNIQRVLRKVKNNYNITNDFELNKVLKPYGVQSAVSREWNGISFYSINEKGERNGRAIAGSNLGMSYNVWNEKYSANIKKQEKIAKNAEYSKKHCRYATDALFKKYAGKITYGDYSAELKKHGIDVDYNINDAGMLIGISFIDHGRGQVYKASDVDRQLSKELKERLTKGGEGESPEIRETNRLAKAMEGRFAKRVKEHYDFRSSAIKFLENEKEEYIKYCADAYNSNRYNAEFAWEKFKGEKLATLNKEIENEIADFTTRADEFLKIAKVIDGDKLTELLMSYNFDYQNGRICDARRPYDLYIEDNTELPFKETDHRDHSKSDKPLSKIEKEFYLAVAEAGIQNIEFDWYNPNDRIFRFLSAEDKRKAQSKMMHDRFTQIADNAKDMDMLILEAQYSGMLIEQRGRDIVVFSPDTGIALKLNDERLINYVHSKEYQDFYYSTKQFLVNKYGNSTELYRAIQRFHSSFEDDYKQQEKLYSVCDYIAQRNREFATDLRHIIDKGTNFESVYSFLIENLDTHLRFKDYDGYRRAKMWESVSTQNTQKKDIHKNKKGRGI